MQAMLGAMPNISDKTGEPEYMGETKTLVDSLRKQAQAQTFDKAIEPLRSRHRQAKGYGFEHARKFHGRIRS
jgi:hypothetical protein